MPLLPLHVTPAGASQGWSTLIVQAVGILGMSALAIAGLLYAIAAYRRRGRRPGPPATWRMLAFGAGIATLAAALSEPTALLAQQRFSSHMLQHLVLLQVSPPLILLGRPERLLLQSAPRVGRRLLVPLGRPWLHALAVVFASPIAVFLTYGANLSLWHLPGLYNATLLNPLVHELEHLLFLMSAFAFWWLVVEPLPAAMRASPQAVVGLALAICMVGNVVAAALTLSPRVLYEPYALRAAAEGIDPLADQRLGGAIMWLSGAIYFIVALGIVWRATRDSADLPSYAAEFEPGHGIEQHEHGQP